MKVIFNSRLLSNENFNPDIHNRAFCYGDGLFETIVTGPERLNLIDFHLDRLKRGCKVMRMKFPGFSTEELEENINKLTKENSLTACVRTRVQVWRNSGGLYTPDSMDTSFLISSKSHESSFYNSIDLLGDCHSASISRSAISFAKTMSALPYVLAGLEKLEQGFNDLIIYSSEGYIAESISANVFWIKDNELYTPSLASGCIDGVMRRYLLETWKDSGLTCYEVLAKVDAFQSADSIFMTNASGISWVKKYKKRSLKDPSALLKDFIKLPLLP